SLCQCQLSVDLAKNGGHPDNKTTTTTTTTKKPTTTSTTTTTTEAPKTTTHKPEPPVVETPLVKGNITNDKHEICLRYHFSLLMRLSYMDKENKTHVEDVWLPKDSHVESDHCGHDKTESFWFIFNNNNSMVNMTFEHNEASVYLASLSADVKLSTINEHVVVNIAQPNPNFNVDKSHSYVCANNVTIKGNNDDNHVSSEFLFSNLTMQAFMKPSQNGTFSDEHNCQNEINDVVPIAVGAALTALVIIVMIAYFIGRRRSRRLAYQSV
ncbi:Lysosome-associated membrane glycoprotein (Lamp)-like protein, partial [Euroglyphus maynei]